MHRLARGKTIPPLPQTFNIEITNAPARQTVFSDTTWGKATRSYATSARSLTNMKFEAIFQAAQQFIILNAKRDRSRQRAIEDIEVIDIDDDDEWACLVDHSDNDEECKLFVLPLSQPH